MLVKREVARLRDHLVQRAFKIRYLRPIPALALYADRAAAIRTNLYEAHRHYVAEISSARMAISLELACMLWFWCDTFQPRTILDLGSGFSSYVFRTYQARAEQPVQVYSVDDSPEWLEKTAHYLSDKLVSCEHLLSWNALLEQTEPLHADLILHDLATIPLRAKVLPQLERFSHQGTYLIVDDLHRNTLRKAACDYVRQNRCHYDDLRRHTMDSFGRYAWCIYRVDWPRTG